jgi:hypothetical protein
MTIYIIAILIIVCVSIWLTLRGRKKKILAMPEGAAGFGHRDEKVTITFADGTIRESTWGEIAEKVRDQRRTLVDREEVRHPYWQCFLRNWLGCNLPRLLPANAITSVDYRCCSQQAILPQLPAGVCCV